MDNDGDEGYYRVSKVKNDNVKNGYVYRYTYPVALFDNGNITHSQKYITCTSLEKLEKRVKNAGLEWCKKSEKKIPLGCAYVRINNSVNGFSVICPPLNLNKSFKNYYDVESFLNSLKKLGVETVGFEEDKYWKKHKDFLEEKLKNKDNVRRGEFQW